MPSWSGSEWAAAAAAQEVAWRADIGALAFRPAAHRGLCFVHRRALQTWLGILPDGRDGVAVYAARQQTFQRAAAAKIARAGLHASENFHLTSRDLHQAEAVSPALRR